MTELKGFGFASDDEEKEKPLPGTNAHLMWVEKKKKLQTEPVDKDLLISQPTVSQKLTVSQNQPVSQRLTVSPGPTVSPKLTVSQKPNVSRGLTYRQQTTHISDDSGNVTIESNYMRMDMDVFRAMADMGHSDKLVYLDLVRRAYGAFPKAKNICSCTYYEISETSGIKARDAISASVQWLEDNSYIKRLLISRQKGIKSLYRVFLPCEIPGRDSRTKLTFNDDGIR
jgi:hypothetical protein